MKFALCLLVGLLFAVSGAQRAQPRPGSLSGHIELGPIRPVQRPGEKERVPPEMYKAYSVTIATSATAKPFLELKLSGQGNFAAELSPGVYVVTVKCKTKMMNPPEPKKVIVTAGKKTSVTIVVDTGIR